MEMMESKAIGPRSAKSRSGETAAEAGEFQNRLGHSSALCREVRVQVL